MNYRNVVMEQIKIADELHISFSETERMSILDRRYCMKYVEMKSKALAEAMEKKS